MLTLVSVDESLHAPLCSHGCTAHSLVSTAQVGPSQPVGQAQKNVLSPSKHAPPFTHGSARHSSVVVHSVAPASEMAPSPQGIHGVEESESESIQLASHSVHAAEPGAE